MGGLTPLMPFLYIRTVNQKFEARDDGRDYDDLAPARRAAIASAVEIASEEINNGKNSVIIESFIESESGSVRAKLVVSLNVSDMKV